MKNTTTRPIRNKSLMHRLHKRWNTSRWNSGFEPFISTCACCCTWCQEGMAWWKCVLFGHSWNDGSRPYCCSRPYCYRCHSEKVAS